MKRLQASSDKKKNADNSASKRRTVGTARSFHTGIILFPHHRSFTLATPESEPESKHIRANQTYQSKPKCVVFRIPCIKTILSTWALVFV